MSSRDWTFRIQDILTSIEKIERYTAGLTMTEFRKEECRFQQFVVATSIRNYSLNLLKLGICLYNPYFDGRD